VTSEKLSITEVNALNIKRKLELDNVADHWIKKVL
jgi:hypothetical protein